MIEHLYTNTSRAETNKKKTRRFGVVVVELINGICQDILKRATSKRPTSQKPAFRDKLSLRY